MDEFGDKLRTATGADARRRAEARAPKALRARIGRARYLKVGGSTAVALVALAGVVTAGIGFTGMDSSSEPSPGESVDLSIDGGETAYATVSFPEDAFHIPGYEGFDICGEPAPSTSAPSDDFSMAIQTPESLDLDYAGAATGGAEMRATTTLSFHGDEPVPVFVDEPRALFIRDGIVVGVDWNYVQPSVTTLEQGGSVSHTWEWMNSVEACETDNDWGLLESGEYSIVVVSRVHNSEEDAARHSLTTRNFALPSADQLPAYREGSYECSNYALWGNFTALTCEPNALPGVEIDEEARTATVPYDAEHYSQDVDLTYVSDPIPVTLNSDAVMERYDEPEEPPFEPGMVPACGDQYSSLNSSNVSAQWTIGTPAVPDMEIGDDISVSLWPWGEVWESADITLPQDPRLWLVHYSNVEVETDDPGYSVTTTVEEVVGWLDTRSDPDESPLEIVRYDGPGSWPLTITDVQWCEGFDIDNPPGGNFEPQPLQIPAIVAAPGLATFEDGRQQELDALVIRP